MTQYWQSFVYLIKILKFINYQNNNKNICWFTNHQNVKNSKSVNIIF